MRLTNWSASCITLDMPDATKPGLAACHDLRCSCDRCCTARAAEAASRGVVVRFESSDDMGTECGSLYLASCEPPTDPESRIVLRGGRLLAEAHPERAEWMFSAIGKALIEIEALGAVAS